MDDWRLRSRRATYILLVGSFLLIGPGLAGVGATLPVAVGLAALAAGLWAVRDQFRALPTVAGYDLGWYARDSWLGAAVCVPVVLVGLGGPPAELQALGGFVGLVGMVNYFLRPLYLLVADALWRLLGGA
ncbi:hypothetical protein GRX03_00565 [Halovenus sp. WSH3]|uniref:Uncharacterized protein n=1 Tax=Halovenus carboxidivorans TaxID=2692199 RepID=A0A6B0T485_9EURY|nr:hypothetical protein [Halovenus carboxidivorans]MXR50102.1 hypothetical protein [Halovenus carboxidivorans]